MNEYHCGVWFFIGVVFGVFSCSIMALFHYFFVVKYDEETRRCEELLYLRNADLKEFDR